MKDTKQLKIAYIGGGSKLWARSLMQDLALTEDLGGEVALYDIDPEAADRNRKIAERIFQAFLNQPLCDSLSPARARELFGIMCRNTREYLEPFYPEEIFC